MFELVACYVHDGVSYTHKLGKPTDDLNAVLRAGRAYMDAHLGYTCVWVFPTCRALPFATIHRTYIYYGKPSW